MRIDKAKELTKRAIRDINNFIMAGSKDCALSTVLTFFKPILAALDENPLELEQVGPPQSEFTKEKRALLKANLPATYEKSVEWQLLNIIDRQSDEIKRLKESMQLFIDNYKAADYSIVTELAVSAGTVKRFKMELKTLEKKVGQNAL